MTYKVLKRTQEDAFSLFMRGLEPKTWEQVGFHIEGDLGQAMAMVRRWMCGEKNQKRTKMDKTHKNLEGIGRGSRDHKLQIKQKAREGEAGFWACNRRKETTKNIGEPISGFVAAVTTETWALLGMLLEGY